MLALNASRHPEHPYALLSLHPSHAATPIPRWPYMTDEAKPLTKRSAVSTLVLLVVLLVFRSVVPWVVVALVAWGIWKAVRK